jgi:hypothetical protein
MNQSKYIFSAGAVLVLILVFWYLWRTPTPVEQVTPQPSVSVSGHTYASSTLGFSIQYPSGYSVDENYHYQALGPGKEVAGVRFTIPPSVATGTNLSSDSYLSVERLNGVKDCSASLFLEGGSLAHAIVDGTTTYSVASSTGAGAGNRYEETVYALQGDFCVAVRYMVHYGVIENYPVGMVHEFDRAGLLKQFDEIRRTLVVVPEGSTVTTKGSVILVDTKQSEVDGPLLISVRDANGKVSIVAVPARGLGLCAAKDNIADAFSVKAGDNVEVSGTADTKGRIVPCNLAEDYFRMTK